MVNIPKWHPLVVWPVGNGYRIRMATHEEYTAISKDDLGIVFPTRQELMAYLDKHFDMEEIARVTS